MALSESSGSTAADGTEQTLWDTAALAYYAAYIFLHNMVSGDILVVKVYVKDVNSGTMRLYKSWTYTGAQTETAVFIPFLPTSEHKVTIQQTAGVNRTYKWNKYTA